MAKYKKVFVTIGDIGFLSAKMVKITTTSKLTWEAAKPWAQKCISTTLTNLKDLESDYEEMTLLHSQTQSRRRTTQLWH
jgi:hypothetical protein